MSDFSVLEDERVDDLERSNLKIIQNPGRFCFGMDAVLLTGFVTAKKGDRVLDMGTGTGIIPILLSAKCDASSYEALEIQKESADMARRSVALNHLEEKIHIVEGDIKEAGKIFGPASFKVVTCNPPYMIDDHGLKNPGEPKAIARHEVLCTFEDVAKQASVVLEDGGKLFIVHRPFRLAEIMNTLIQNNLEPKRMRLVYPYIDHEPNMVLIEACKGGRSRITVEKPLIIFKEQGVYTEEITEVYGY